MVKLRAKIFEIEQGQNVVVLNEHQAAQIGVDVLDRVRLRANGREIVAIVNHSEAFVRPGELLLFAEAAHNLRAYPNQEIEVGIAARPQSLQFVRKKLDGETLSKREIYEVIEDLQGERLSSAELAAFIAGIQMNGLSPHETSSLTNAIFESGQVLSWPKKKFVVSEHSIGGVAGDRTSMMLVPILASLGITVPKTVARAISSASGTADAMEVLAPVALDIEQIKKVVARTDGCIAWGGKLNLAAADDKLIRIRNPLRLDPDPLLLSSIMAKKRAEGARFVLLDIPYGRGAKIENLEHARKLAEQFRTIGYHQGIKVDTAITDGSEPTVRTIGPAMEARIVLETLEGNGSSVLLNKACQFAGLVLANVKRISKEEGFRLALRQVKSKAALKKFKEIIEAQGGDPSVRGKDIEVGELTYTVKATQAGEVSHLDNRDIAYVTRYLGAPTDKRAGLILHARKHEKVQQDKPLFTLYATDKSKLTLAIEQLKQYPIVSFERVVLEYAQGQAPLKPAKPM